MAKTPPALPDNFIAPLLMNGLQGRMLHLPAAKPAQREILLIYGLHSSLEYWWPLAREWQRYGNVTMPDLPGFGGMQSFTRIHEKPSLDNLADYLAAFVKLRYRSKRFTVVGVAYGFVIVTRMLQRYPDLAKKVDLVVSLSGLVRYDDINFSRSKQLAYWASARLLATPPAAFWVRQICLHPLGLRSRYGRKQSASPAAAEHIELWRRNDIRTHLMALATLMKFDNCRSQVARPLLHVAMHANRSLDHHRLLQHLQVAYQDVQEVRSRLKTQTIGSLSYPRQTTQLLPLKLRRILSQL